MTAETNCLDCAGSVTVYFEFEPADPSVGLRGGIAVDDIKPNDDCTCATSLSDAWTRTRTWVEHAEEAARDYLLASEEAVR